MQLEKSLCEVAVLAYSCAMVFWELVVPTFAPLARAGLLRIDICLEPESAKREGSPGFAAASIWAQLNFYLLVSFSGVVAWQLWTRLLCVEILSVDLKRFLSLDDS